MSAAHCAVPCERRATFRHGELSGPCLRWAAQCASLIAPYVLTRNLREERANSDLLSPRRRTPQAGRGEGARPHAIALARRGGSDRLWRPPHECDCAQSANANLLHGAAVIFMPCALGLRERDLEHPALGAEIASARLFSRSSARFRFAWD